MAITVDYATKVITVPQSDCTLISGTIYELDTENDFRLKLMALFADENHIWMNIPYAHNTEVTIAGTIYARAISIINGYTVEFSPNSQWSVVLKVSNNDIWDVESGILVQNQVQVIPTNAAGLIVGSGGITEQDKDDIASKTWAVDSSLLTDRDTIGGYVARSLLSLKNFLGNK